MYKRLINLIFFLFIIHFVFSQNKVAITVVNSENKNQISNVKIEVQELNSIFYTNEKGFVEINSSNSILTIKLFCLGYTNQKKIINFENENFKSYEIQLIPDYKELNEFVITANRVRNKSIEAPSSIFVVDSKKIEELPVNNTDDILKLLPGINIDRDFGIFSKNSSISMRGINGSARNLILLNGLPINKTDGGGINWNRINPDDIDRVEVLKGPASALYGGNAMGGIVNIITKTNKSLINGRVKVFGGTYNTYGGNLLISGYLPTKNKIYYYGIGAFYRSGDGYFIEPELTRDSLDAKTYLKEYSTSIKFGRDFKNKGFTEIEYNFYDDKRGDGFKVFEKDGGYNRFATHFFRSNTLINFRSISINANLFYQNENFIRQVETIKNKTQKYTLYNSDFKRVDYGAWLTASLNFMNTNKLTLGVDFKNGSIDGEDNYKTTTDILRNKGEMNFYAVFAQFEKYFKDSSFIFNAGLRVDKVLFSNGSFSVNEPTNFSAFMNNYPREYNDTSWFAITPKLGFVYIINNKSKIYISYARGFRPPILDDMCKNGNITKGFKMANPNLKPEVLDAFDLGTQYKVNQYLKFDVAFFYSMGSDFQYFYNTGDSTYTGGNSLKPILQRTNIAKVEIYGTEISTTINFLERFQLLLNYTHNYSIIKSSPKNPNLEGKFLMEVPENLLNAYFTYSFKSFSTVLSYNYRDKQFSDDENTQQTGVHSTFDFSFNYYFPKKIMASVGIQDLFDNRFTDAKGMLSPGRFFMFSITKKFNSK